MTVATCQPEATTEAIPEARSDDFVDLFTAQYPKLVGVLRVAGGVDKAAAEDVAQEAFARTLGHWHRVRHGTNPAGYVYRVAFRLLRKRGGLPQTPLDDVNDVAAGGASTEDAAVANVSAAQVLAAMPPRRRACAALCWYLGFTSEDAGDILGIDAATVRTHLERARRSVAPVSPG